MSLPSIKETIDRHGLNAKKSLGQHFLLDLNITRKIASAAAPLAGVHAIEIGPGPGGLTRALLESDAADVTAIEKDARCIEALQPLKDAYGERFQLREEDALSVSLPALVPSPRAIVANLPYNIGTELIVKWLYDWHVNKDAFQSITVMLQKEVAERIAASTGGKEYGRLSVLSQWICNTRLLFELPPGAFTPPPKVTSTVLQLKRRDAEPCDIKNLERVTKAAFGNRRKMLRQSLKSVREDAGAWCEANGIDPTRRAETLSVQEFVKLANTL